MDFIQYVLSEAKSKRLSKADALDLFRQFQEAGSLHGHILHPLVHRNTSTLGEQRFSSSFSGKEFFLKDCKLQGQKTFPAAAQLDMARAAVAQALDLTQQQALSLQLEQVRFGRPATGGQASLTLHVALMAQDGGTVGYEIYSVNGDETVVHSQGRVVPAATAAERILDLNGLKAQCLRQVDVPECQDYEPGLRVLTEMQVGKDSAGQSFVLARIALPQVIADSLTSYVLHPTLVDAALQASTGLMQDKQPEQPALPFAVERVSVLSALPPQAWVEVRYSAGSSADDAVQKLDIAIADDEGRVCVQLQGFSSRKIETHATASSKQTVGTLLLQPSWQEQALPPIGEASHSAHHVLLCEAGPDAEELEMELKGGRVSRLTAAETGLAARYTSYAAQLLQQVQDISQAQPQGQVAIQLVVPAEGEGAVLRGLSGLLKSAQQENARLVTQTIAIDGAASAATLAAQLQAEAGSTAQTVRHVQGRREILQIKEAPAQDISAMPWKDGGVYLITGGAGGLGLIFAQAIASRAKSVRLVLTGRSELGETRQASLDVLRSLGAQVEYRRVDVGDAAAVQVLIDSILAHYGQLNGILHSAGVLRDSFLAKKTAQELNEVFAPKVAGVINLDEATRHIELDCFILFSSIAGLMGNVGQADYAAANAFLDGYAEYRNRLAQQGLRHGRTLSVNWPLWEEGGMQIDAPTRERLWRSTGMMPLESEAGVQALHRAWAANASQMAVVAGDIRKIDDFINKKAQAKNEREVAPESLNIDPTLLEEKNLQQLRKLFGEVTKLESSMVDPDEELENYGLDSIMITQLMRKLEEVFGELPRTLFFEYRTLRSLAHGLAGEYAADCARWSGLSSMDSGAATANIVSGRQHVVANGGDIAVLPSIPSIRTAHGSGKGVRLQEANRQARQQIAIIGLSGCYPQAGNLQVFWENLKEGRNCIGEVPSDRWDHSRYFDAERRQFGKSYSKWGGFIEGFADFDPLFFNISPHEAHSMDPQERLFIQASWAVLEDAGYTRESLASRHCGRVGVFTGITTTGFVLYGPDLWRQASQLTPYTSFGSVANRVSYLLNLHGPSLALDTMCSSSLTAIHEACIHLERGECEVAIAGGVNVYLHPSSYVLRCSQQMLSASGQCRSFGDGGDGYVPGEGVGAVLLKPLQKAIEDGDRIYGVIKGSSLNHGGKTNGYTVPNPKAQGELIAQAIKEAGIHPRVISYIEAHGTGTALGDPIEIAGLSKAFAAHTSDTNYCAIGSVKSNIGHCESAAGIAGLTKVLLQMQHKTLVKSLHSETLNPHIDFGKTPFVVQRETARWERPVLALDGREREYPRIAGISSFGAGGANAHLIVEEYVPQQEVARVAVTPEHPALVVLSARNEERLQEQAAQLRQALEDHEQEDLADIAYTLQIGREAMDTRVACVVSTLTDLKLKLDQYLAGTLDIEEFHRGDVKRNKETMVMLSTDEDSARLIDTWLAKGKLSRLVELWVKGLAFDWNKLYGPVKPRCIGLPTYPFARERYWAPELAQALHASVSVQPQAQLHPLLHNNTSSLSAQRFSSRLSGGEFFLQDHLVQGRKVLPGAAQLELAHAAALHALEMTVEQSTQLRLEQVVFARPVTVDENGLELHIALEAQTDGAVAYEIYSGSGDESIVHGQGRVVQVEPTAGKQLDLTALQTQAGRRIDGVTCYESFAGAGLEYGPSFRGLEQVRVGKDGEGQSFVLALIILPAVVADSLSQYVLHPSLVDAALQACAGLVADGQPHQLALPFAVERVNVLSALPPQAWVEVRYNAGSSAGDAVRKFDIAVADDEGHVCVQLQGFSSRVLPQTQVQAPSAVGALTLIPSWETLDPAFTALWPQATDNVLLIAGDTAQGERLRQRYAQASCLQPDANCRVEDILSRLPSVVDHVIWLVGFDDNIAPDSTGIIRAQGEGVLYGMRLIKALLAQGNDKRPLGLTVITQQTQAVANEAIHPAHAGVHGLFGSLAKEYPHWQVRVLDLPTADWPLEDLLRLPAHPQGNVWIYRERQWHQQKLLSVALPTPAASPYRHNGVYVLLGGAGGIGEVFTEHLIRSCQAQVIWIGRRPLDAAIDAKCDRLGALGPRPRYIAADATDLNALRAAREQIKTRHGTIHGIVHATIVLKDQTLARMEETDFTATLSAKVDVSVHMAQAFRDDTPDFVLFFSSVQSSVKGHGQSNYAAGCTFIDAHAQALRRHWTCPVKVVNWGYWGSVGIVATDGYRERMSRLGLDSVEPEEAMQLLDRLLSSPVSQVNFLKTSKAEIAIGLGYLPERTVSVAAAAAPAIDLPAADSLPLPMDQAALELVRKMETLLGEVLSDQLHELNLLQQTAGLPALYHRWLEQSLRILHAQGHIDRQGNGWKLTHAPQTATLWQRWESFKSQAQQDPHRNAQITLLDTTLKALPNILQGRQPATQVMFPNASMDLVEGVYKNNRVADYFNEILVQSLEGYLQARLQTEPQARIRLIEIGAGTGGTSAMLFERLAPYAGAIAEYCYTDIAKAFLLHGQEHYAKRAPYLQTRLFNVEAPLAGQGLEAGSYDIAIATNVLHATRNMRRTLHNVKALLKRQGIVLINEMSAGSLFTHLTFGLLEGWWLYDDTALRIEGSPALAPHTWQALLQAEGFHSVQYPAQEAHHLGQQIIVAASDGVIRQEVRQETRVTAVPTAPACKDNDRTVSSTDDELREKTITYLKTLVSQTLKIPASELDAAEPWTVYGIDSILGLRITDTLAEKFDGINSTSLFEHQSIGALAAHLLALQRDTLVRTLTPTSTVAALAKSVAQPQAQALPVRSRRLLAAQAAKGASADRSVKDIAIIGLSGRYPRARNINQYWNNLQQGIHCIGEIPKTRWDWQAYYHPDKGQGKWGTMYSKWGGFIDDMDCFDPLFFGISPREAERMAPQERLFLEEAYACIADAGYTPATVCDSRQVGVFAGVMNSNYGAGPSYWSVPNRVSFVFGFNGPSMAVDTACSSSLTALHLALESLYNGSSECALAGGVNLIIDPIQYMTLSAANMLSSGDACRSFGADADGFVDAEGVGVALLKPLHKAIEDGDRIYGVIKGSSLNHGGKTNGYTVPNPKAQGELVAQAIKEAGIHPRAISYIEAHGTGTALGDPIEIAGLSKAFAAHTSDTGYCAIGSVKSNIGHCESAAGIAGLTKVLLQMQHKTLVKSLHSETLNPHIDFGKTPFVVQRETARWERPVLALDGREREYPRIAGISSFGAGGANAHLIVEEYVAEERESIAMKPEHPVLAVLSAKNEERLREQAKQLRQALDQHDERDLADIAYTLQVGREAMDTRVACVVSTLTDLKRKLDQYLEDRTDIDEFHSGDVKRNKEALAVFTADEELQEVIAKWLERGKLSKLADLWVKGLAFDWNGLYSTLKPKRIGLPSYPFARERYWLPALPQGTTAPAAVTAEPAGKQLETILHPLLHRNTSNLSEQRFSTRLSGGEFFLQDHQVQGQKVLPGAAQLELAHAAALQALGLKQKQSTQLQLEQLVFARPVAVDDNGLELHIALEPQAGGAVHYEIYSGQGDDAVIHGQGRVLVSQPPEAWQIDLSALQAQAERRIDGTVCYQGFAKAGLEYGPSFRGLEQVQTGKDGNGRDFVLARIVLPQVIVDSLTSYVLHPALVDAALQASIGLMLDEQSEQLALPFAVERVSVLSPLPAQVWVEVRYSAGSNAGDAVQKLDLTLADDEGRVCVQLQGFSSRKIKASAATPGGTVDTLLLQPSWQTQALPQTGCASYIEHHVLLCEAGPEASELQATLPQAQVLRLSSSEASLAKRYTGYAAQLLQQVQDISQAQPQGQVAIQLVVPAEGEGAVLLGLSGLLKSAQQENTRLVTQTIAIDGAASASTLAAQLQAEAGSTAQTVRHVQGRRAILRMEEAPASNTSATPWKDGGVYLITGGAGGLGLIFAQAIVGHAQSVRLVLTGRSELGEARQASLNVLRNLGAQVEYRSVDVGDAAAVQALIDSVITHYGQLNGIVHSAGVLRDSFLAKKTAQELNEVFAPKVAGLANMDEATRDVELDCFVLFSSISGVMGNVGQADYAAANAFLDGYAAHRNHLAQQGLRHGRTLSVNWPLWEEGGMQIDAPTRERLWRSVGMTPLESEAGVQALYRAWAASASQIAVFAGDIHKIARFITVQEHRAANGQSGRQATSAIPVDSGELQAKVEAAMTASISALLKIDRADLDVDTELSEFGFDSITLTSLGNDMSQKYGLELSPTALFEYPTIRSLAGYLARERGAALAQHFKVAARPLALNDTDESAVVIEAPAAVTNTPRRRARFSSNFSASLLPPRLAAGRGVQEPVAIIGISGCFPQARDLQAFWENLDTGRDCIAEIPDSRWNWNELYGDPHTQANKTNVKRAGLIDGMEEFDPMFFGISPREAEVMDPQQRLLMMHVWKAIEDAGYNPHSLSGSNTGLFIGTGASGYNMLLNQAGETIEGYSAPGMVPSVGPNRMSYLLNLHGPSEPIETACSSSLVAIHRALLSMQAGQCEMAIVGGVNTLVSPEVQVSFSKAGMLCEDGRCKTFSAQANGYVRGEGVGMLMLKKLSAAERDGDHIYAVIRGSAENHGGRSNSLTAPNPRAQANLIKDALRQAGVEPASVGYIEAHGTGTPLGDPIEVQGLSLAFKELAQERGETSPAASCGLGSIKTNIGHLELAAGVAGVIKVLLQMKHKTLVKSLHSEEINPYIQLENTPFYVVQEKRTWEAQRDEQGRELPRRAGVSSFGFGGVNAHVVLEEYIPRQERAAVAVTPEYPAMVILSAKDEERLREQARQLRQTLDRHNEQDLADIAYTLQVGREAMEARVACVVTTLDELKRTLDRYLEGSRDIEEFYHGDVKRNKETLSVLGADEDTTRLTDAWLAKGKLSKILGLWVKGLAFDWNKLYGAVKPRRISLPTYPFARERYWIPDSPTYTADHAAKAKFAHMLHPLLHRNTSNLSEQRFTTVLSGKEFFLQDHQVHGRKILPGAAQLEMASKAAAQALELGEEESYALQLEQVVFARPVMVDDNGLELHIALEAQADGTVAYEIYSGQGDESIVHGQGRVVQVEPAAVRRLDLSALQVQVDHRIDGAACYEGFAGAGLEYGPSFRGLEQVQVGKDGEGESFVLARIVLPTVVAGSLSQYVLHPSLVDAALQACAGLVSDGQSEQLALPFAVERVSMLSALPPQAWVEVRCSAGSSADDAVQKLDIAIADDEGNICVQLRGFSSRKIKGTHIVGTLLLQPCWQEQALPQAGEASHSAHHVLLCEAGPDAAELEMELKGARVSRLMAAETGLAAHYTGYAAQLLQQVQAIAQSKPHGQVVIQLVVPAEGEVAVLRGLGGLLKSAQQENARLVTQTIAIDGAASAATLATQLQAEAGSTAQTVRHVQGRREILQMEEAPVQGTSATPWKDGSVYLITGGAGGLGLIFAQAIASRAKSVRLVLTGRSELSEGRQASLDVLRSLGAQVEYQRVDVGDAAAVQALIDSILAHYGQLNGILHSAGVLRDGFLAKKTAQELSEVFAPKVAGVVNLDEATRHVELDCFVLFSSIAGLMGNVGQADYAAANAFLDGYAEYRNRLAQQGLRHGRTLSVNWPLWDEGGMQIDVPTRERLWRSTGMMPLESEAGVEALHRAWAAGVPQMALFAGDVHKIARLLTAQEQRAASMQGQGGQATSVDSGELQAKVEAAMTASISTLLKIDRADLDPDTELSEFGFDSITLTSLGNEMNQKYGLEVSPTAFFEYPTIRSLAGYLAREHDAALAQHFSAETHPTETDASAKMKEDSSPKNIRHHARQRKTRFDRAAAPVVSDNKAPEPIAIIGASGFFPQASNLEEYWKNFVEGRNCIHEIPAERWSQEGFYCANINEAIEKGKSYCKVGGFLSDLRQFERSPSGMAAQESAMYGLKEHLFLKTVEDALESAGYSRKKLREAYDSNVGVYVGAMSDSRNYFEAGRLAASPFSSLPISQIAHLVSRYLDLSGPSIATETQSSSSITAVHLACESLRRGDSQMAIAGGVTLLCPEVYLLLSRMRSIGSNAASRSFLDGDGLLLAEGAGTVLLKPLDKAIADGDGILAVIRSSSINYAGGGGIGMAPNLNAQARLFVDVIGKAGIDPRSISYVESAAYGSPIGDLIEMSALTQAFRRFTAESGFCAVGSAKSYIGHAEAASGMSQLLKVVLQMRHKQLIPLLQDGPLNPNLKLEGSPFYLQLDHAQWCRPRLVSQEGDIAEQPLRAMVNSFGAGGAYGSLIVEEYRG